MCQDHPAGISCKCSGKKGPGPDGRTIGPSFDKEFVTQVPSFGIEKDCMQALVHLIAEKVFQIVGQQCWIFGSSQGAGEPATVYVRKGFPARTEEVRQALYGPCSFRRRLWAPSPSAKVTSWK